MKISGPFVVACLAGLLSGLDTSVNIAFPAITAAFEIDVSQIQWVVVSFVLTYSVLLLPAGRLGDRIGHGRIMVIGIVVQGLAFVWCSLASSFEFFLLARVSQGASMALILGTAPALVTLSVSERHQPRALGIFAMTTAAGLAAGAPVGGLLLQAWDWQSVYAFRVPYMGVLLVAALLSGLHRPGAMKSKQPLDLFGAVTLALGLGLTLFVASRGLMWGWTSPITIALALVAMASLVVFHGVEKRTSLPLVDMSLFRKQGFGRANLLNALANASMFSIWFLGPYLLVDIRGHGPIAGGLILGIAPTSTAISAWLTGRMIERLGLLTLTRFGLACQGVGLVLFSQIDSNSTMFSLVVALCLVGIGLGSFQVPNMSFVMASLSRSQQGVAGGMTQMVRTAGLVGGLAVWNTAFVGLRDRRSRSLGVEEVMAPEVFVPTFGQVVCMSGGLAIVALILTIGVRFDDQLTSELLDEK